MPEYTIDLSSILKRMDDEMSEFPEEQKEMEADFLDTIKSNLNIGYRSSSTHLIILAKSSNSRNDPITKVQCMGGTPIGGYTYDAVTNCYHMRCAGWTEIGYIPISISATTPESSLWSMILPVPQTIIMKHLNTDQIERLENFKAQYPDDFTFEFVQMVD